MGNEKEWGIRNEECGMRKERGGMRKERGGMRKGDDEMKRKLTLLQFETLVHFRAGELIH